MRAPSSGIISPWLLSCSAVEPQRVAFPIVAYNEPFVGTHQNDARRHKESAKIIAREPQGCAQSSFLSLAPVPWSFSLSHSPLPARVPITSPDCFLAR